MDPMDDSHPHPRPHPQHHLHLKFTTTISSWNIGNASVQLETESGPLAVKIRSQSVDAFVYETDWRLAYTVTFFFPLNAFTNLLWVG